MIQVMPGTKVYLACRPVSMRYGFDGLAAQVKQVLAADPFSGHLACLPSGWRAASSFGRRSWMAA